MTESLATRASPGHRTLCLPIAEEAYRRIVAVPAEFRRELDDCFRRTPELFPADFARGYQLKDNRSSANWKIPIRRIITRDGVTYTVRPSFLMPYMVARTKDVEGPLFLRKFAVRYWALARVFGNDPMYWYRLECGLGRFSIAGTTVRQAELPEHLLADEHHQTIDGKRSRDETPLWLLGTAILIIMFFLTMTALIASLSLFGRMTLMPFGRELLLFPNRFIASVHTSPTGIVSRFYVVPDAEMTGTLRRAVYLSTSTHRELAQWIRILPGGPQPTDHAGSA